MLQAQVVAVQAAETLDELVAAVTVLLRSMAVVILEAVLAERAARSIAWPECATCGRRLHSKGWVARTVTTSLGVVDWRRRVGRCPIGCPGSWVAPLVAVFVPLTTATAIVARLSHVQLGASTVWHWVQTVGQRAQESLEAELSQVAAGGTVIPEALSTTIARLLMIIGADGVMVPFRPTPGSAKGATAWREVKVAVMARLAQRTSRHGHVVSTLCQRRLVAVHGDIDALAVRLKLEALRQGVATAPRVAWISDGARGLWRVYRECLAPLGAIGVLDFYHAAQTLYEAGEAWFASAVSAQQWFPAARHDLRHGRVANLVATLREEARRTDRGPERCHTLERVAKYLDDHVGHLHYPDLAASGVPLGSGFVESAVKWLIQQRFKGVGMRWSEAGFDNLLMLRLAWANGRFDDLFLPSPKS